jgi:hypothetical protein
MGSIRNALLAFFFLAFFFSVGVLAGQDLHQDMNMPAQEKPSQTAANISDSKDEAMSMKMNMEPHSLIELVQQHATGGTDAEPASTPSEMPMRVKGNWTLMFHGQAFLNEIQQSGPRGGDKLFSTNWFMPMGQRKLGNGTLTLRTMLSLEPATISQRRYPDLFQQGETAFGLPIADGQHPHNFFMELAALYDYKLSEDTMLSFYAAPVGDPAIGPMAYPHRASASEDPVAPLGHHLEDSTHISDDVVTVGVTHRSFRLEASGFHGREPNEHRWEIDLGRIDSWSTRLTVNAGLNWSFQYSIAQLHSPEALFPNEDVRRMTASLTYNLPVRRGNWDSMILWGRNQSLMDGNVGNGYLLESTLQFLDRNQVWTRIENVDRTNELLLGERPLPPGFEERYVDRVQAYTVGYERDVAHIPHLSTAIGAQLTWYGVPDALKPIYDSHPLGGIVFLRVRPRR